MSKESESKLLAFAFTQIILTDERAVKSIEAGINRYGSNVNQEMKYVVPFLDASSPEEVSDLTGAPLLVYQFLADLIIKNKFAGDTLDNRVKKSKFLKMLENYIYFRYHNLSKGIGIYY